MYRVRLFVMAMLVAAGLFASPPRASEAQTNAGLCFKVPGITDCIYSRFRQYWEQNGGLPVFGYPVSPPMMAQTAEGDFQVQFFERSRFELHPANNPPYDVLLSRLGDDQLRQQGRNPADFPKATQKEGCLFFAQTGHNVCNQEGNVGFRSYWESHGLQDPRLNQFGRSLALFGLPLSEPMMVASAAGQTVLTQWFERARFEFHPNNPGNSKVLLGLLGNETRSKFPPPGIGCARIALPSGASIVPSCLKAGGTVTVEVSGFAPNQDLNYWVADETGFVVGAVQTTRTDAGGRAKISVDTRNFSGAALQPGNYVLVARDAGETLLPATAPFRVVP